MKLCFVKMAGCLFDTAVADNRQTILLEFIRLYYSLGLVSNIYSLLKCDLVKYYVSYKTHKSKFAAL